MNLLQQVQELAVKKIKKSIPQIKPGLTVKVHQKIQEGGKERIQVFEGLVIKLNSGHAADKTFTVRKVVGGIGVEKIFALYSPKIDKIQIVKSSKVRRSKLYYMRDRSGKSARLKESFVSKEELENLVEAVPEEQPVEETAEETAETNAPEEAQAQKTEEKTEEKAKTKAPEAEVEADKPEEEAKAPHGESKEEPKEK